MSLIDTKELIMIADEDFESAKFLTQMHPTPLEIICFLCSQSIEKYLKSFLLFNEIIPNKTHNLNELLRDCKNIHQTFSDIDYECRIINKHAHETRYTRFKNNISESDMKYALKATEKVKSLEIFNHIREQIKDIDF